MAYQAPRTAAFIKKKHTRQNEESRKKLYDPQSCELTEGWEKKIATAI